MTTTTHYAAIDATNLTGAVYGTGLTPEAAEAEARRPACCGPDATLQTVEISPAAAAYVEQWGGAPSRELHVSERSHCLGAHGERLPSVHLRSECEEESDGEVSDEQIATLRSEAGAAGDRAMVHLCDVALSDPEDHVETAGVGQREIREQIAEARAECARAIESARAAAES
jgi:hypothetical protein